ncbi:Efflux transporter, outer membrane factor lipoprotein, NodT family [Elysia marginata]|uniref:Efflux transporter, outer membrane factor lipoprotein, NodT family n=1 Tax=Elysia marginata TaxID=1093978 RepID=A0AAV4F0H4_9GAST|nr:Efflux transporter, outer membrane factor lipoprotein, NodT family [Elysia marginata]
MTDYTLGLSASWEIDIWKKLRNAKKVAFMKYLSSIEGKHFLVTKLVSEIARMYYELLSLDNQLEILNQNIDIQQKARVIMVLQKKAAKVTELAVKRFEAEIAKNKSHLFYIRQAITETENRINFLVGRYPQHIKRDSKAFLNMVPQTIHTGIPSQLLENRPDIRQATLDLSVAKLNIKIAKAHFYPSFGIRANVGYQAFRPEFLLSSPESIIYSITGDIIAPLVNRNAIKTLYYNASSKQVQAVYNYEQTLLKSYVEVANLLSKVSNLEKSYTLKMKQVNALTKSIDISTRLFRAARADYMEVLLTQRDALDSKIELIETKRKQMEAVVNIYNALGGGWR